MQRAFQALHGEGLIPSCRSKASDTSMGLKPPNGRTGYPDPIEGQALAGTKLGC